MCINKCKSREEGDEFKKKIKLEIIKNYKKQKNK